MNLKRILFLWLHLLFLSTFTGCLSLWASDQDSSDLRVMSFNIRNSHARDWEARKGLVYEVIRDYAPDVLGLQEANSFHLKELSNEFPEYGQVGEGSMGGSKGQHSAILFLEERFKLTDSGSFWLSKTPTQPSKSWRSAHHRICTWAELLIRETDRTLYIYNTHMDDGSREARENGTRMIMEHIQGEVQTSPFVFMGDFNAPEDSEVLKIIKGNSEARQNLRIQMVDSFRVLYPDRENVGTYNGFTGQSDGSKIDYIMVRPSMKVIEASILQTSREGRYPSDHFPVTAQVSLP
ncbi:MAG: endonuclease/exonuclease/phosphatase family protein [Opitutales bacterium]|nr:endonuclease/exonuclease/phosphatase family protein [Opitutales bacterium]